VHEAKQPWAESSKTMSKNKSFFPHFIYGRHYITVTRKEIMMLILHHCSYLLAFSMLPSVLFSVKKRAILSQICPYIQHLA
jgi:hypothetical protein